MVLFGAGHVIDVAAVVGVEVVGALTGGDDVVSVVVTTCGAVE